MKIFLNGFIWFWVKLVQTIWLGIKGLAYGLYYLFSFIIYLFGIKAYGKQFKNMKDCPMSVFIILSALVLGSVGYFSLNYFYGKEYYNDTK